MSSRGAGCYAGAMTAAAGFTVDHRTLAELAREVEEADPIAWGSVALDPDTVYELIASQIARPNRSTSRRSGAVTWA